MSIIQILLNLQTPFSGTNIQQHKIELMIKVQVILTDAEGHS